MQSTLKKLIGVVLLSMMHVHLNAEEGLDAEKLAYFRQLPKAELHLHLGGSFPKNYIYSLSTKEQQDELEGKLKLLEQGLDYHEAFSIFQLIGRIVNTEEKIQKGVEALCVALREDGVSYVEIRTGLKDLGNGLEEYLHAVLRGMESKVSAGFTPKLILSLQRHSSLESARATIDLAIKYRERGVVGIDISGDSTIGDIETIYAELLRGKDAGLSYVVHIGESPREADQLKLLEMLQPVRVGHGVHLSEEARSWIIRHSIPLEACLTSSVLVRMIDHYSEHPGIQLFRQGHPVVFCTDDPLLFSTTLSKELLLAHELGGLSLEEAERVAKEAIDFSLDRSCN